MKTKRVEPEISERHERAFDEIPPFLAILQMPERLRSLVAGLDESRLARRPAPNKWSIKEILAHLADGEIVFASRLLLVASQERPTLPAYDQDAIIKRLPLEVTKGVDILDAFVMARLLTLWITGRLPAEAHDRIGVHEERGEETVGTMIRHLARHDRVHAEQIETIRLALFASPEGASPKGPSRRRVAAKKKAAPAKVERRSSGKEARPGPRPGSRRRARRAERREKV